MPTGKASSHFRCIRATEAKSSGATSVASPVSASVAGFGQLLRGGKYTDSYQYDDVLELARNARGRDAFGYRGEFISLVNLAKSLQTTRVKG